MIYGQHLRPSDMGMNDLFRVYSNALGGGERETLGTRLRLLALIEGSRKRKRNMVCLWSMQ